MALAITGAMGRGFGRAGRKRDVSHLDVHADSFTAVGEDGYNYEPPAQPFPVSSL